MSRKANKGYNLSALSASSADEELNGGIFDTASYGKYELFGTNRNRAERC